MKQLILIFTIFLISLVGFGVQANSELYGLKAYTQSNNDEHKEGLVSGPIRIDPDFLAIGISTGEKINTALFDSKDLNRGQRILTLLDEAERIVEESRPRVDEIYVRIILNRCVDIHDKVLPIAGYNTAEVARWISNYLVTCFEHAASYANNRVLVSFHSEYPELPLAAIHYLQEFQGSGSASPVSYLEKSSFAFGHDFAQHLYEFTAQGTSDAAQAVMLIKIIDYLGYDMQADIRMRHPNIRQSLLELVKIQKSRNYLAIAEALRRGQSPTQAQVASLRLKVYRLISRDMPSRVAAMEHIVDVGK